MDISKHAEFFNPLDIQKPVHIIGVGAIGSHLLEQLVRLGIEDISIYDFDVVEPANVANQMYDRDDIRQEKVVASLKHALDINPQCVLKVYTKGWVGQALNGYVFLSVDKIEVRRAIVEQHMYNNNVLAMFDFRMRLSDAQHYAADWTDAKQKENFLKSMQFTHEEAMEATPVSACGTTLSIIPTIKVITALGIANFINFVKGKGLKTLLLIDAFTFDITAF